MTDEQFAALMEVLTDIRNVLFTGVQAAEEGEECSHPEELRISLATMSDPDHWVCGVASCRYEHRGLVRN